MIYCFECKEYQIIEVYNKNVTNDSIVGRWLLLFNKGHTNIFDKEQTGQ